MHVQVNTRDSILLLLSTLFINSFFHLFWGKCTLQMGKLEPTDRIDLLSRGLH